jgi:hypothetical protein
MEVFKPGVGMTLRVPVEQQVAAPPSVTEVLMDLVPTNAVRAFADGNVAQVVVLAVLLGVATLLLGDGPRDRFRSAFDDIARLLRRVVDIILIAAPFGIGALMALTVGRYGARLFGPVARFVAGVTAAHLVMIALYLTLLKLFTGGSPFAFLKQTGSLWATTVATTSSLASLSVALEQAEKLRLPRSIYAFTLPLGIQINKDGTAILLASVVLFTAQATGMTLTGADLFSIKGMPCRLPTRRVGLVVARYRSSARTDHPRYTAPAQPDQQHFSQQGKEAIHEKDAIHENAFASMGRGRSLLRMRRRRRTRADSEAHTARSDRRGTRGVRSGDPVRRSNWRADSLRSWADGVGDRSEARRRARHSGQPWARRSPRNDSADRSCEECGGYGGAGPREFHREKNSGDHGCSDASVPPAAPFAGRQRLELNDRSTADGVHGAARDQRRAYHFEWRPRHRDRHRAGEP